MAMTPCPNPRTISPRVSELPSLRYGRVGAHSTMTGPLRVAPHYPDYGCSSSKYGRSLTNPNIANQAASKPIKPTRRVRFDLPTTTSVAASAEESATAEAAPAATSSPPQPLEMIPAAPPAPRRDATKNTWLLNQRRRSSRFSVTPAASSRPSGQSVSSSAVAAVTSALHTTGRYLRGTLSPTTGATPAQGARTPPQPLLRAAKDADEAALREILKRGVLVGIPDADLNATDTSGRTAVSYIVSNGSVDILESILQVPGVDVNRPDNEGNTPLHFAAQAGQVECLNFLVSRCAGVDVDARNNLGFTPLMKAALQGRNKCAKLLLFAGASPTMRDTGRGLRAEQWARFCGRYVCAEVIEKFARHRLLDRSTCNGRWGSEPDIGARILMGKVVPQPPVAAPINEAPITHHSNMLNLAGIKSKIRKVFRTSSSPGHQHGNNNAETDLSSGSRLVTQLTSAALCASTPALPTGGACHPMPALVKSLVRPLTVPKLQVTLVNNNGDTGPTTNLTNGLSKSQTNIADNTTTTKVKKKK